MSATSRDLPRVFATAFGALLAVLGLWSAAQAQGSAAGFPDKPIRLIVGFAAAGGNDIFARVVGDKLGQILGQNVVVENRPGAGGRLSAEYVAGQPADGYTLLVGASGAMSIAAAIYPDLKYHPTRSFVPLSMIANFPLIVTVADDSPAKSVQDLVAWGKAHPDKANYATTSPAFTIATELFKLKTGMPGVAVFYKSSNEMLLSLLGGQTLLAIPDPPPTIPMVKGGKVRALAVTGSERAPLLPDVPTMAEVGFPDVDVQLWSGIFAPAGTPPAIAAKLEAAIREALKDPRVAGKLRIMAVNPGGNSSAEFTRMIDNDIRKFSEVVKAANLKFDD
jgi:tripartite-type tricarboxylate transporter receptor subunit TctC